MTLSENGETSFEPGRQATSPTTDYPRQRRLDEAHHYSGLAWQDTVGLFDSHRPFRYTEWLEGKARRELYDHTTDSGEVTHLAADPRHAARVARLSTRLKKLVQLKEHKR